MLETLVNHKQLEFGYVVFDAWYSDMELIKQVETYGKIYYDTIKGNRKVCEQTSFVAGEQAQYLRADELLWSTTEETSSKLVHVRKFPKDHTVQLFR